MGRSVKKGPYVQEVLYKRVKAMNDLPYFSSDA